MVQRASWRLALAVLLALAPGADSLHARRLCSDSAAAAAAQAARARAQARAPQWGEGYGGSRTALRFGSSLGYYDASDLAADPSAVLPCADAAMVNAVLSQNRADSKYGYKYVPSANATTEGQKTWYSSPDDLAYRVG
eukprot:TRINITY_DN46982_c0_g1_i1.p3 TRINITY_DN46982_c0_g1~~TRINITY_DN46982_c0_g1_i1.p3  ORF type:complete len:138 (+),score=35.50 TRINITY_DN46982_c0_g1_i1:87-500(+)